jgi:hypothetical protein
MLSTKMVTITELVFNQYNDFDSNRAFTIPNNFFKTEEIS